LKFDIQKMTNCKAKIMNMLLIVFLRTRFLIASHDSNIYSGFYETATNNKTAWNKVN